MFLLTYCSTMPPTSTWQLCSKDFNIALKLPKPKQPEIEPGACRGLGLGIAERFAQEGATIIIADINGEIAKESCSKLPKVVSAVNGLDHTAIQCDVTNKSFVNQMSDFVLGHYKTPPHILVNNAGITMDSRLSNMSEEQWDWVIAVNLKSVFLTTQIFSNRMIEAKLANASIINISSIVGKSGNFGQANYAASKAGVIGLTKTCAKELAINNIRVNALLPGFIETEMTAKIPEKVQKNIVEQIPLKHMGEPDDIANACLYLASDLSKYVTGISLEVTGGLNM